MAQETQQITVFKEPGPLSEQLAGYREPIEGRDNEIILLAELGGGALRFAGAAFPGADLDAIYAQHNEREGEGRGPHFDIYDEGLSEDYPWLGVYNLAGTCAVQAAVMSGKLGEEYDRLYPEPTEEAYEARRHFGALVLDSPLNEVYKGSIEPGRGMILPQSKSGPYIVHEVVPENPTAPGSFIKMVVPKQTSAVLEQLAESGFMSLDELLTKGIGNQEGTEEPGVLTTPPLEVPPATRRGRRPRRSGRDRADSHAIDSGTLLD
jgi:hypothetical protein